MIKNYIRILLIFFGLIFIFQKDVLFAYYVNPNAPIINQDATTDSGTSNCVIVKVGDPTGEPKLPPGCSGAVDNQTSSGTATKCTGSTVAFGVEKKLLPLRSEGSCSQTTTGSCGRPGTCMIPKKIVLHTTGDNNSALGIFNYFASGSEGRGVGTQFVVDKQGKVIQMTETLSDKVELAYGVAGYNKESISIEMTNPGNFSGKSAVPPGQYTATLILVKALMNQYGIPLGNVEYTWVSNSNSYNPQSGPGVFGHYQLNPSTKSDPGKGFLRDFRNDLKY